MRDATTTPRSRSRERLNGAAPESNRPSVGVPHRTGFEVLETQDDQCPTNAGLVGCRGGRATTFATVTGRGVVRREDSRAPRAPGYRKTGTPRSTGRSPATTSPASWTRPPTASPACSSRPNNQNFRRRLLARLITYNQMVVDELTDDDRPAVPRPRRRHAPRHPAPLRPTASCRCRALADGYPMSFAAVQKHVAVLERAGLVTKARHGREQLVRTDPDAVAPRAPRARRARGGLARPRRPHGRPARRPRPRSAR